MSRSPIFRRITLTEVKKTSNKRGSLLRELAGLEREEKEIIKNHHDPSYSNWRASFLREEGMTTDGFMQTQLKAEGDTDLATIAGNVEASYQAYEGGSDALSNTAITSSGTGSGSDGGFDLGKDYLAFNGNSTPRYAALKPIDASKFDTIVVTGIRGNDNNGGEDPDETNEDLMVYYQLPGQNTIQRLDVSGGVTQSGIDYKIIPIGSDDSGLQEYSLTLPSYTRAEGVRFILYQPSHHGTGFDNYGVTQINYRRVKPISVFVSLDSPEASSFMRIGSPSKASESKKQREKQLREQLEATKDYTDKKFGENFPGSEVAAPGDEDPTEVEKRAPGLGEFEPEVEDYNTWKQETKKEDPKAQTTEKEYEKWKDDKRLKSFAAVRDAQTPQKALDKITNTNYSGGSEGATQDAENIDKIYNKYVTSGTKPDPEVFSQFLKDTIPGLKSVEDFVNQLPWNDPDNPVGAWIDNNEWWVEPVLGAVAGALGAKNAYKTPYKVPKTQVNQWKGSTPVKGSDGKYTNLELKNADGNLIGKKFINPKTGKWETLMRPTDKSSINDKLNWEVDQLQHTNKSFNKYEKTGINPSFKDISPKRLTDVDAPGSLKSGPTVGAQWAIDKAGSATAGAVATSGKDFETVRKSLTPSGRESEKEKANVTQNVVSAVPGLEAQGVTDLGAAIKASAAFDNMELSPEDEEVLDRMEDDWDAADEVNDKIIQDIGNYKVNIAKSILLNKPIYVDPDSIKVSDKMKYINAIPQNAWGSLKLGSGDGIPFVSTPLSYSDENIYVDDDGKVQKNDGSKADYTKGQGYGLPKNALDALAANVTGRNPLALRGKAQLQVVFPPDGSEPYLRYTDHAYQNRDSKGTDERPDWFTGALSDAVDKLGNLFHRAGNKDADNTDAMAGYSKNIRGDVVTEFDVPLSQLPQEMQDQIASVKKGLGVFNDAGELVKDSTVEYTGTPEQQKDLHKDLNDLYDTDPDRFMEVMQEVQDNPEYKKVEGEITTAREQFTQEKEKATTDLGAVLDQRVDLAKYMRFNSNSSDYKGTLSQYASGTVDKSTAKEIAKLGGVNLGEIDKLRKDYDLDARNKLLSKDVRQGVDSDYTWADSQPEYQKAKAAYDKARNAHSTALDNVVAASSKLNAYIKSMPDHPTKKGYVLMNSSQSAKFQKMRSEYDRLNAIESKAEAKQKSIELEPGNIRSKLVKERRAANDKIREISDKAQDNINKLYKELGDELDELNKLATSRFDPDGELMKKQMNAWDKAAYDVMNPEYQHQQSGFQASNVGGNYAQQAVDQELQDILDRMDNLTGDDLAEYQRLLKLYNQKLNQKDPKATGDPGKRTPPKLPRDEQLPPPRGFPTDPDAYQDFKISGAGGSPGQPYTPPKEDPTNPYVPAPGRGTQVAASPDPGPAPVKPGDIPTQPSSPYLPGKSPYKNRFTVKTPGQQDFGSVSDLYGGQGVDAATLASVTSQTQTKKKKKKTTTNLPSIPSLRRASYKPQGSMITEKRKLKSPHDWFNPDDIKPEYPKDPPPEMVNNYHPDLVDSAKKAERFNKLDPASAKAMPKQDDPNIDAKVEKAKNNPDKDGPGWHKQVSDKIRMARAQQRKG